MSSTELTGEEGQLLTGLRIPNHYSLHQTAQTMAEAVNRAADFLARYGGVEFVCLLPALDATGAKAIAEMLRVKVEDLHIDHAASLASTWVTRSASVLRPVTHNKAMRLKA
jgi:PleD family two-component response regulator